MDWLRAHKVLLVVYGAGLVLAAIELSSPAIDAERAEDPSWFLTPGANIVDTSRAVLPDRANTLYYEAFRASLCSSPDLGRSEACRAEGAARPDEIRELFERALATGNRSNELLLYNYAVLLVQEGAAPAEIEAAVRSWRVNYPRSSRPDPRVAFHRAR